MAGTQPSGVSLGGAMNPVSRPAVDPNAAEALTPEAQILILEAQRSKFIDEGNSAAAIIPPTPLTQQLLDEKNGTPPAPGAPVP